jgi:RimJ/RimL family protein N-acetyltransferase
MSFREIKINHPGDGEWVMLRVGGVFNERTDHVVAVHRDGRMVGGVVFTGYLGASIMLHMAGSEDNWATRDFLWMVFDYGFNQLGCRKLVGLVPAYNFRAVRVDEHLGFKEEARLKEMLIDPEEDLLVLTMTKPGCKWLKLVPKYYRSNTSPESV